MSPIKSLLLIFIAFLLSCATTTVDPLTGKRVYTLLSTKEEIKLGKEYIPLSIAQGEGLYPDPEVQRYISELGNRIASHTPRKLPYRFYILNSSVYNAFAIPGGGVFITRGLLSLLEKESELAGVLAHELGHLNARHHARYMEKVLGVSLLLQVAAVLVSNTKSESAELILQIASIGAGLLTLKFSRDQERESDRLAVRFAIDSGYDPRGLIGVFEKLNRVRKTYIPEWLATHPLPASRIDEVRNLIHARKLPSGLIEDTQRFRDIKHKIKETEEAYKLYEEGKKLLQKGDKHRALEKFKASINAFGNFQMPYTFCASILADLGNIQESLWYANRAVKLDPNLFWTRFTRGYVLFKARNYHESIKELRIASKMVKGYADTYYYLGRNYEAIGDYRQAKENFGIAINLASGKETWLQDAKRRYRRY